MIERIEIQAFQSLLDVRMDLGKFTVIVGQSGRGKSALLRSIHGAAFGITGNDHVTVGKQYSTVSLFLEDFEVVWKKGVGHNDYLIIDRRTGEVVKDLKKVNKSVPEEVQDILDLRAINFAGQWDSPFLLKDSGTTVARYLGELTNVSILMEAAKKGNSVRKELHTELKTRTNDLEQAQKEIPNFADLPQHIEHVLYLESLLEKAHLLEEDYRDLNSVILDLESSLSDLESINTYPDAPDIESLVESYEAYENLCEIVTDLEEAEKVLEHVPVWPEVPDLTDMETAGECYYTVTSLIEGLIRALDDIDLSQKQIEDITEEENNLEQSLHHLLVEAGTCPTCSQSVS